MTYFGTIVFQCYTTISTFVTAGFHYFNFYSCHIMSQFCSAMSHVGTALSNLALSCLSWHCIISFQLCSGIF